LSPVFLSDSFYFQIGTSSVTTGAATNADSTPTVAVEEDGVLMGYAPTVTNITTGIYRVQVDATAGNGFEAGKRYSMYAVATVGGVTGRDGVGEFEVLAVDLNTGVASVTGSVGSVVGLTAANLDVAVSTRAAPGDNMGLDAAAVDAIWDEILDSGFSGRELVRGFASALMAKISGAEVLAPVFRDVADTKNRISATTDATGNRLAVTLDLT